jgi:hypothetical protein
MKMTSSPKTRKPAAKANSAKAEPKGTPQNRSEIDLLLTRRKWLAADQEYQASQVTEEKYDEVSLMHISELNQIAAKLGTPQPASLQDIHGLLEFIAPTFEAGLRTDGADRQAMHNVLTYFADGRATRAVAPALVFAPAVKNLPGSPQ